MRMFEVLCIYTVLMHHNTPNDEDLPDTGYQKSGSGYSGRCPEAHEGLWAPMRGAGGPV